MKWLTEKSMIKYIQSNNALVVFWERESDDYVCSYGIFLNGKEAGSTKNTFYEIAEYDFSKTSEIAVYKNFQLTLWLGR